MVKKFGLLVLLMGLSGAASAGQSCKIEYFLWFPIEVCSPTVGGGGNGGNGGLSNPKPAPELDPGAVMSGLTLLLGGLTVLRAGRRKNTDA